MTLPSKISIVPPRGSIIIVKSYVHDYSPIDEIIKEIIHHDLNMEVNPVVDVTIDRVVNWSNIMVELSWRIDLVNTSSSIYVYLHGRFVN